MFLRRNPARSSIPPSSTQCLDIPLTKIGVIVGKEIAAEELASNPIRALKSTITPTCKTKQHKFDSSVYYGIPYPKCVYVNSNVLSPMKVSNSHQVKTKKCLLKKYGQSVNIETANTWNKNQHALQYRNGEAENTCTSSSECDNKKIYRLQNHESGNHWKNISPEAASAINVIADKRDYGCSYSRRKFNGVSPQVVRKRFFETCLNEYPTSNPSLIAQSLSSNPHIKETVFLPSQVSLDVTNLRKMAEEDHCSIQSRMVAGLDCVSGSVTRSASWDNNLHDIMKGEVGDKKCHYGNELMTVESVLSPTTIAQTFSPHLNEILTSHGNAATINKSVNFNISAKERRKLFKKSSSVDSAVNTRITKTSVTITTASVFSPSRLFAHVKGKITPAFNR